MKNLIALFSILMIHASVLGQYNFNTTMETYQSLSNPTSINDGASWTNSSVYAVYFNFDFQIGEQTYTALNVNAGGGLSFPGQGNIQLRVFGHPDSGYLLADRNQLESASPISYEISGSSGEQILKIQWENAGFREWCDSSDPDDFVDYQIWIYEGNNKIEVRFGESVANAGAYGLPDCNSGTDGMQFIFQFDICDNALSLTGNADLPSYDYRNHCIWQPGVHVSGTPSTGIVYNLTPLTTNIVDVSEANIQMFPNPASTQFTIESDQAINQIEISNLSGKVLKSFSTISNLVDIADLNAGIYFIRFTSGDGTITKKFAKQ